MIMKSEGLVKLRALAKLCSKEIFNDATLLVVAWRRILEVLVLAMPPVVDEKKARGEKKQKKKKKDPKKLEIFDVCFALGLACNHVADFDDVIRYLKRAKDGYEEQLGPDDAKALEATYSLIMSIGMSDVERIEKLRDLLKRCERALGEENVVTLETLNTLGSNLNDNEEYEEAIEIHERCLTGRIKVSGEDHKDTLDSLNNLGIVYKKLEYNEKVMEYYERALQGYEKVLGKNHPSTLRTVMNTARFMLAVRITAKPRSLFRERLRDTRRSLGKIIKKRRGV